MSFKELLTGSNLSRLVLLIAALLLSVITIRFLFVAYDGLFLFEFGDESEKYVASRMLVSGKHLYKDIFSHHGPLLYMLVHAYIQFILASQFDFARAIQIGFVILSSISIFASPVYHTVLSRVFAVTAYIAMLTSVWLLQGLHMLLYHSVAGFLFVVALSQLIIPAVAGYRLSFFRCAISAFFIGLAVFSAYTFLLSALLFLACGISCLLSSKIYENSRGMLYAMLAGFFCAVFVVFLWLFLYGDIKGYLIYHLYFNQKIYANFVWWLSPASVIQNFVFSFSPDNVIKIIINTLIFMGFLILIFLQKLSFSIKKWPIFFVNISLMFLGIYFLSPRGEGGFTSDALLIVSFAFFAMMASMIAEFYLRKDKVVATSFLIIVASVVVAGVELVSREGISSPNGLMRQEYDKNKVALTESTSDRYRFIQNIVKSNETIQVLPFGFSEYIYSNRLPSTGQGSYLPWQAAYKRNAIVGYKMDICQDLLSIFPPLIIYHETKVWDRYVLPEYEPCIMKILYEHYIKLEKHPEMYVQYDRFIELGLDQKNSTYIK